MCLPQKLSGETVQFIASTVGSLQFLNFGLMFGLTPFDVKLYQSPTETPFKRLVNAEEASWLAAYLFLGVAAGSLIFGILKNKIGPKTVLVLSGLLQLTSWFCLHFADDFQHIQASRAFNGAGAGAAFTVLPIFITEITKNSNITAKYIAFTELWRSLGIILGFLFAIYLPNILVPIIGIVISMAFTMVFPFVQESPYYLMNDGNVVAIEKSLRWYRGIRHIDDQQKPDFIREVADFTRQMKETQPIVVTSLPLGYKMKLSVYCLILILCTQLSGVYFILNYVLDLYVDVNAALIFGGVQVASAFIGVWLCVKINRKILLSLSGLVSGFSLVFLVIADKWQIISTYSALTVSMMFLSLHIISANMGLYPIAAITIQELLPLKLRSYYTSIITTISWILLFLVVQSYQYVAAHNLISYFGFFAGMCFLVAIVAFAFLPETQAKSSEEVQRDMGFAVGENIARLSTISGGRIQENTYL